VAGRGRPELEGLSGLFVKTLGMRGDLSGGPGFREVVRRVRRGALEAYAHQEVPYERLVAAARSGRGACRGELFRVMFAMQNAPLPALQVPDLDLELLPAPTGTAKFDLTFFASERDAALYLTLEYSAELFEESTAERMLAHYVMLLGAAAAEPDRPVASLPMLTEAERQRVLVGWNAPDVGALVSGPDDSGIKEALDFLFDNPTDSGTDTDE
jgi:non-ribosomal peptide synthetase component F